MNNKNKGRKNNKSGHFAELIARLYLNLKGYRCLAQNYHGIRGTSSGEVDLIMKKNRTIVFVEVKKRSDIDVAAYAVLPKQKARILRTAEIFLQKNPSFQDYNIRFDAVLFCFPLKIRHIRNAWIS